MPVRFAEVCDRLDGADDLDAVRRHTDRALSDLGFAHFTYLTVSRPDRPGTSYYFSTYPKAWTDHYEQRRYVTVDPVMLEARTALLPFQWRGEKIRSAATGAQLRVFDEAGDFGIRDGITAPVHGADGEFAVLSATPAESGSFDKLFRARRDAVHLLALHCHAAVRRLLKRPEQKAPRLSPRELECLKWTAAGKTAWEIGEILNLSESTVVWHLNNAKAKLGVYGKSHAVVKAMMLGLISV